MGSAFAPCSASTEVLVTAPQPQELLRVAAGAFPHLPAPHETEPAERNVAYASGSDGPPRPDSKNSRKSLPKLSHAAWYVASNGSVT